MFRRCYKPIEKCLSIGMGRKNDGLMWNIELKSHAYGEYSIAVVQANNVFEDQTQVCTFKDSTFVGVYDGHGGPQASHFVHSHLFSYLHGLVSEQGGVSTDVIRRAFSMTEEEFIQLVRRTLPQNSRIASTGTCCLVGAILKDELFVANLGDSRAVLGRRASTNPKWILAERLTTDHNVTELDIRREVEALDPDDPQIVVYKDGVWRIKGIIQVSRSIGDAYLKLPEIDRALGLRGPVLTAEPSIIRRQIMPQDSFLIFASDGLWEQLSDQAAVEIVSRNPRAGIAKRLVTAAVTVAAKKVYRSYGALTKMEKGVRRSFHDDISVVVVYLDHSTNLNLSALGNIAAPKDIFTFNTLN